MQGLATCREAASCALRLRYPCACSLSARPTLPSLCAAAAQAEYERVKAAYADMSVSLEGLSGEKRRLETAVAQMEADGQHSDRERRSLEQQVRRGGCHRAAQSLQERFAECRFECVPMPASDPPTPCAAAGQGLQPADCSPAARGAGAAERAAG